MVQYARFANIGMKQLLPKLTARLHPFSDDARALHVPRFSAVLPTDDPMGEVISQAWLWPRMAAFFKEKDVIVSETGTSSFGVLDVPLPRDSIFVSQILWGSIGWTVGTCLVSSQPLR